MDFICRCVAYAAGEIVVQDEPFEIEGGEVEAWLVDGDATGRDEVCVSE